MKNEFSSAEKMFESMMDSMSESKDLSNMLSVMTGDVEFQMIVMLISTLQAIIINNDLQEFIEVISPFLQAKAEEEEAREKAMENKKPTATDDLLNKFTANGMNGVGLN